MNLSKETLMRIIQEELELAEQDGAPTLLNPIELEKQIEKSVASYLGQNTNESYEMIQGFIVSLMDLKKRSKTRVEP